MFRTKRPPLTALRACRVAVLKLSALGDVVHSLPVLHALRQRFPDARITWVVNRSYEELIRGHPALDETLPFDRGMLKAGPWKALGGSLRFIKELRKRRFDLVIDLQGLLRSGLMALATGARRRVGFAWAREGAAHLYTDVLRGPGLTEAHAVDRYWGVAEALGVGDLPKRFTLPVPPAESLWAERALQDCPRPWLVLAVGARWRTKRWPPEHFAALARRAQERFGGTAVFVGAPDEAALARQVIEQLPGPWRDFAGRTRLAQLAALLARADVVLANDTGPLHLAAALGRPVVAPYTCTQVRLHGPYGAGRGAVESGVWCRGSYLRRCDRLECMSELQPDRLWVPLNEVLSAWASRYRSA